MVLLCKWQHYFWLRELEKDRVQTRDTSTDRCDSGICDVSKDSSSDRVIDRSAKIVESQSGISKVSGDEEALGLGSYTELGTLGTYTAGNINIDEWLTGEGWAADNARDLLRVEPEYVVGGLG